MFDTWFVDTTNMTNYMTFRLLQQPSERFSKPV